MGQKTICELLAPAGSLEKLKTAIHYGADAVYLGGEKYSLRAHATNFSEKEIKEGVAYAHQHGVKVYVTVNIFAHNRDLASLPDYLLYLQNAGADGLIISDPGIFRIARKVSPELPIHLSTQANVTNSESALFWIEQGARRLNLARELGLAELSEIRDNIEAEIEVFVHGALCISYSGRCMLSNYLTGRNANQGDCAHPCRYSYRLEEAKRPDQFFPVEEDQRGTYIFNSKDLCLINRLPDLISAGVDSIKIEGRMKGIYYAGGMVRIYRAALDAIQQAMEETPPGQLVQLDDRFTEEINKLGSRGYTENFFDSPPDLNEMRYNGPKVEQVYIPAATVCSSGSECQIKTKHTLRANDRLELMGKGLINIPFEITELLDKKGKTLPQANPGSIVTMKTKPEINWDKHSIIRKVQPDRCGSP